MIYEPTNYSPMTPIFHPVGDKLVEQPRMKKPETIRGARGVAYKKSRTYKDELTRYKVHLSSLRTYTIRPEDWQGITEVREGEFEVRRTFVGKKTIQPSFVGDKSHQVDTYQDIAVPVKPAKGQSCFQHKKEIAGISDMKVLAEMIGDLHYETLCELFDKLTDKLMIDAAKDRANRRVKLANSLERASAAIQDAAIEIETAYDISKPFMNPVPVKPAEKDLWEDVAVAFGEYEDAVAAIEYLKRNYTITLNKQ